MLNDYFDSKACLASKYALPYHPTSSREEKSLVILGIAWTLVQFCDRLVERSKLTVTMIAVSSNIRKAHNTTATMTTKSLIPVTYSHSFSSLGLVVAVFPASDFSSSVISGRTSAATSSFELPAAESSVLLSFGSKDDIELTDPVQFMRGEVRMYDGRCRWKNERRAVTLTTKRFEISA